MAHRVVHLMLLIALIVVPAWAQCPEPAAVSAAAVETEPVFVLSTITASCFQTCMNAAGFPVACNRLGPPERDECIAYRAVCNCQCGITCA